MSVRQTITDAFGYILVGASGILAWWELAQQRCPERDPWLVTRRRLWRRMTLCLILAAIGVAFSLEARGVLSVDGLKWTFLYAGTLTVLALVLVVLAAADAIDTVNAAARKSLSELEATLRDRQAQTSLSSHDDETQARDR